MDFLVSKIDDLSVQPKFVPNKILIKRQLMFNVRRKHGDPSLFNPVILKSIQDHFPTYIENKKDFSYYKENEVIAIVQSLIKDFGFRRTMDLLLQNLQN